MSENSEQTCWNENVRARSDLHKGSESVPYESKIMVNFFHDFVCMDIFGVSTSMRVLNASSKNSVRMNQCSVDVFAFLHAYLNVGLPAIRN